MNNDRLAAFEHKFVQLAKLINAYTKHFPKNEKYALSSRIKSKMYELLDYAVESNKRYSKKTSLTNLDISNEQLKRQLLIAYELGYFSYPDKNGKISKLDGEKRFMRTTELINELGRIIGGWIKHNKN